MPRALKIIAAIIVLLPLLGLGGIIILIETTSPAPPEVIAKSVDRDAGRLARALALPVAKTYPNPLRWQGNGSTCGPTSVLNVFDSMGADYAGIGDVLDGTGKCWTGYCLGGLTLDELAEVGRQDSGREVVLLRDLSLEAFTEHMKASNDPQNRYIINFHREPIFGMGGGHHSPIGGYLEGDDLVLVLDVNEAYGAWLIERERLFAAMDTLDGDNKRGLLRIR